ncbi:MAG: MarR family transcriptional regulator [Actinomycetales bacterium]|nr:MarR family transcriptional regulator [Actinomycetales bacterium]
MDDVLGTELRRGVIRLSSRFRSERMDGEVPDAALLVLLALDTRGPLSLTALAENAHVTLGSISQTVRRLEQLAYLVKSRDSVDRRRVLFSLTESGRQAVTASRQYRRDWLSRRLAELSDGERAALSAAAPILIRLADS